MMDYHELQQTAHKNKIDLFSKMSLAIAAYDDQVMSSLLQITDLFKTLLKPPCDYLNFLNSPSFVMRDAGHFTLTGSLCYPFLIPICQSTHERIAVQLDIQIVPSTLFPMINVSGQVTFDAFIKPDCNFFQESALPPVRCTGTEDKCPTCKAHNYLLLARTFFLRELLQKLFTAHYVRDVLKITAQKCATAKNNNVYAPFSMVAPYGYIMAQIAGRLRIVDVKSFSGKSYFCQFDTSAPKSPNHTPLPVSHSFVSGQEIMVSSAYLFGTDKRTNSSVLPFTVGLARTNNTVQSLLNLNEIHEEQDQSRKVHPATAFVEGAPRKSTRKRNEPISK